MSRMMFGTVDKAENKVTAFGNVSIDGYASNGNKTTEYTNVVELSKGQEMIAKLATTADGFKRVLNVKYQIKNLTTGILYDYNNVGDIVVPTADSEKSTWNPSDYRTLKDKDNSMWSIYLAGNIEDWKNPSNWQDFSKYVEYPIEDNRSASNNGVYIKSGATELSIYDSCPDGWFGGDPKVMQVLMDTAPLLSAGQLLRQAHIYLKSAVITLDRELLCRVNRQITEWHTRLPIQMK